MMKIYTRTGDTGQTSLLGGERVGKNDLRIDVIGAVDETNAAVGVARAELARDGERVPEVDLVLAQTQHLLFNVGAELAYRAGNVSSDAVSDTDIAHLEETIDAFESQLEPLRVFILPGGTAAAAQIHMARCLCRRAERRLTELAAAESVRGEVVRYLNRLSDLLFVLARVANRSQGVADVAWEAKRGSF